MTPDNDVYREVLEKVRGAFSMMPYLHGAIPATLDDVRGEVLYALTEFWSDLEAALK